MEKVKKKKNNTDESDFSENEILDLNSLKPFEFESKTNIRVVAVKAMMIRSSYW